MTFDEIFKIVDQIFSEDGFSVKGFKVKFDKDTDINIKKNDTSIVISFPKNEPVISIKKMISFSSITILIMNYSDYSIMKKFLN